MFRLLYPKFWQKRGLISYILWPFSQIYILLSLIRKLISPLSHFNAKVICVGNLTVGGTGKTQIVIWLAKFFQENNISFVILTKGYSSRLEGAVLVSKYHKAIDVGDESIMLSKYGQVVASRRPAEAVEIINKLGPRVVISDDGMQNPSFHKDFVILAIDGDRAFGNGYIIPAGPLREPAFNALNRCDAVVIINFSYETNTILKNCDKKIFKAKIVAENKDASAYVAYYAFSGIGDPERFFNTLKVSGMSVSKTKIFPDHYNYLPSEMEKLITEAKDLNLVLITTRKDYVRISTIFKNCDIRCFDIRLIIEDENQLMTLLDEKIL
ncbi:MAG: tetraacyldisaccharide 4'-kinase [Janthinobacterium lividum]